MMPAHSYEHAAAWEFRATESEGFALSGRFARSGSSAAVHCTARRKGSGEVVPRGRLLQSEQEKHTSRKVHTQHLLRVDLANPAGGSAAGAADDQVFLLTQFSI